MFSEVIFEKNLLQLFVEKPRQIFQTLSLHFEALRERKT